jgi:1,4-dihydroxy-2-naphthoate octaprenyltransferase
MKFLLELVTLIRFGDMIAGLLLYLLGGGISSYLGTFTDWRVFWLGLGWVQSLLLANGLLVKYFDRISTATLANSNQVTDEKQTPFYISSRAHLFSVYVVLTILALITFTLVVGPGVEFSEVTLLLTSFLCLFFYSLPPFRWNQSGYGELIIAFLITFLIPGIAFLFQNETYHRLLILACLPLFFAHLMCQLVSELKLYSKNKSLGNQNMMMRSGWQTGVFVLNVCLLGIFLSLGLASILGMPRFIIIPGYLLFPLAMVLFWQIRRITSGDKPLWGVVSFIANGIFFLMAYLFSFAFWTN